MEQSTQDFKGRELNIGDLVVLVDDSGLLNDEVLHKKGDILQLIGKSDYDYAVGCFIHCQSKKRTDIFSDRTLKINKIKTN